MMVTGPISSLDAQVGLGNLINSDKFLDLSRVLGIPYIKRDFLFRSGVWRGKEQKPLFRKSERSAFILLGHSDCPTTSFDQRIARCFGVEYIFGSNLLQVSGFSTALPLGLTNPTNESDLHPILGDVKHLERAWDSPEPLNQFRGTALVGFSQQTNPIRKRLLRILSDERNALSVSYHNMTFTKDGRIDFLSKARAHDMVLCPEGNGFDTHRFWETLYMGGVPVVVKNPYLNPLFQTFPCIILDAWEDLLDIDLINSSWVNAKAEVWDASSLSFDFWKTKIESKYFKFSRSL
jgi:hypothetical protein